MSSINFQLNKFLSSELKSIFFIDNLPGYENNLLWILRWIIVWLRFYLTAFDN